MMQPLGTDMFTYSYFEKKRNAGLAVQCIAYTLMYTLTYWFLSSCNDTLCNQVSTV